MIIDFRLNPKKIEMIFLDIGLLQLYTRHNDDDYKDDDDRDYE